MHLCYALSYIGSGSLHCTYLPNDGPHFWESWWHWMKCCCDAGSDVLTGCTLLRGAVTPPGVPYSSLCAVRRHPLHSGWAQWAQLPHCSVLLCSCRAAEWGKECAGVVWPVRLHFTAASHQGAPLDSFVLLSPRMKIFCICMIHRCSQATASMHGLHSITCKQHHVHKWGCTLITLWASFSIFPNAVGLPGQHASLARADLASSSSMQTLRQRVSAFLPTR